MAVSSTTDYFDDSLLAELFEDPLISSLIDRNIPPATTSSHLTPSGTDITNRRHWSQDDTGSHASADVPSSTTSGTDLKHLLNAEVMLKTDVFNSKKGTINTISYDGLATVTIDGGIQIRLPYCALQLIPPKPGDKVVVVSGALKGLPGTLLSAAVESSDGIFMSQLDHKIWVVKLHTLAKVSSSGHPSSSYPHQHHHHHNNNQSQQLRVSAASSSLYSHQVLSPTSPLTPTTPTPAATHPSNMFLGLGSPLTPTTPTSMRNSPMYNVSMTTWAGGGGGLAPSTPTSPHTHHTSSSSRQTHLAPSLAASSHPMFSMTDGSKQSLGSHHSFLKMPTANVTLKNIVGSMNKCDEGPSTKEWLEYLVRKARVKKEMASTDDDKDDIKTSVVQISLVCPVSQRRMEYPCRGIHCKHLQCFDAEAYINMNKSWRPKMKLKTVNGAYHSSLAIKADSRLKCPVCNKHTPFDTLYIDKDLMEVIRTTNVNDVEWVGGAWRTIQKASQNDGANVIDLTLSDSDNE